jgi:hypothetical protein
MVDRSYQSMTAEEEMTTAMAMATEPADGLLRVEG